VNLSKQYRAWSLGLGLVLVLLCAMMPAFGQTVVQMGDTQTTVATAAVTEQARVIVPAGVTFNVTNIAASTAANAASVTVDHIVLNTASKQLKISVKAAAESFAPSVEGATTWSPSAVTWNAASWTNATGATGTLSSAAYNTVATCTADAADCGTTGLVFTLAPNTSVKRSGNHTLTLTWTFESIAGA
jgi:hypothetical protein